ncbi:hypothetical protein Bbelb_428510 [Branchiostoma belcheri]|nr:hypothetical protein Bbelb_428510 [Branchiostoma belcheri]
MQHKFEHDLNSTLALSQDVDIQSHTLPSLLRQYKVWVWGSMSHVDTEATEDKSPAQTGGFSRQTSHHQELRKRLVAAISSHDKPEEEHYRLHQQDKNLLSHSCACYDLMMTVIWPSLREVAADTPDITTGNASDFSGFHGDCFQDKERAHCAQRAEDRKGWVKMALEATMGECFILVTLKKSNECDSYFIQ